MLFVIMKVLATTKSATTHKVTPAEATPWNKALGRQKLSRCDWLRSLHWHGPRLGDAHGVLWLVLTRCPFRSDGRPCSEIYFGAQWSVYVTVVPAVVGRLLVLVMAVEGCCT